MDNCEEGHHRINKINMKNNTYAKEKDIKKDNIIPGHMVLADHYILRASGRIYHTRVNADPPGMLLLLLIPATSA